jgi:hypothetical protein
MNLLNRSKAFAVILTIAAASTMTLMQSVVREIARCRHQSSRGTCLQQDDFGGIQSKRNRWQGCGRCSLGAEEAQQSNRSHLPDPEDCYCNQGHRPQRAALTEFKQEIIGDRSIAGAARYTSPHQLHAKRSSNRKSMTRKEITRRCQRIC